MSYRPSDRKKFELELDKFLSEPNTDEKSNQYIGGGRQTRQHIILLLKLQDNTWWAYLQLQ